ncbi:uncharacterized protein [Panulirus ornatus]|uniref:uncharacterized protein isoform X1 n=1 Tax=Panulirus ornatus TaxID=150431 RepID=UPI003A8606FA
MERTPKKQLGARVYFHRTAVFVLEAVEAGGARGIRTLVWFFPPVAGAGRDFSFDHFKDSSVAVAEKVPCGTQLLYPRRPHQYSRVDVGYTAPSSCPLHCQIDAPHSLQQSCGLCASLRGFLP